MSWIASTELLAVALYESHVRATVYPNADRVGEYFRPASYAKLSAAARSKWRKYADEIMQEALIDAETPEPIPVSAEDA